MENPGKPHFPPPQTQDPQAQRRKAIRAKNLLTEGYGIKTIERTLKVSFKSIEKWAEIHGIQLDSKPQTS